MSFSHNDHTNSAHIRKELLFVCCKNEDIAIDRIRQLQNVFPSPTDTMLSPVSKALRARTFQSNRNVITWLIRETCFLPTNNIKHFFGFIPYEVYQTNDIGIVSIPLEMSSTIDVILNRIDRIFRPHEIVQGQVVISSPKGFSHQGLAMKVEGSARLQVSTKSKGFFESPHHNVKPLELVYFHLPVAPAGKVPPGISKFPFEFELQGNEDQKLLETYHGVYISVKYAIICDCIRSIMKNKLQKSLEFVVEVPLKEPLPDSPQEFHITPKSLENVRQVQRLSMMPSFHITGKIHRTNCPINLPFTGEVIIEEAKSPIKSVELQLIRVESVAHDEGIAKDATEIQNVQIGWGDVCRQMPIPIYMIFPRLFTCPTMLTPTFKVEFETNVVVLFENGSMITENFPITLYR
ncbi:putative vacuolar protein sorting protein 26 related protein [Plasmopara halstedii]